MSITRGKSHPTYLYALCHYVVTFFPVSKKPIKYHGITLTDELSWSSHVRSIHNRANSTLGFVRRNLRRCPAKLKETAYRTLHQYAPHWNMQLQFGTLIWPGIVTYWKKYSGDRRGLSKGITGRHPV